MSLAVRVGWLSRFEVECMGFLGNDEGAGDYLWEAVDRARETLAAALTRARAELAEEIDRAERREKEKGGSELVKQAGGWYYECLRCGCVGSETKGKGGRLVCSRCRGRVAERRRSG